MSAEDVVVRLETGRDQASVARTQTTVGRLWFRRSPRQLSEARINAISISVVRSRLLENLRSRCAADSCSKACIYTLAGRYAGTDKDHFVHASDSESGWNPNWR